MNSNNPLDFHQDRELIVELLASLASDSETYRFARLLQAGIDASSESMADSDAESLKSSID